MACTSLVFITALLATARFPEHQGVHQSVDDGSGGEREQVHFFAGGLWVRRPFEVNNRDDLAVSDDGDAVERFGGLALDGVDAFVLLSGWVGVSCLW